MDENELREAMRSTMVLTPEPPPMESAASLTAGRRAVRRRTTIAGAAAVTALATLGVAVVSPSLRTDTEPAPWAAVPSTIPDPADSKPTWPIDGNGLPQEDATARSGVHYEQAKRVQTTILDAVPDGLTVRTALGSHQAAVERDGTWTYQGVVAVTHDNRTGRLLAEVRTAGNTLPQDPCALTHTFWNLAGDCSLTTVGMSTVGVVTTSGDDRIDQVAAYRHADGTVVFMAQARKSGSLEPLADLPLTAEQLAAAAADRRFLLE
ncbi:hypothetical protein [Actinoplanes friuliensis]|uniref:Uncharacterized protein n=1 Tax=Actinoplanes friuliensis DSM 7358 TaxID=1246995 RepID=U5W2T9_9ACTN|nr:hypothetical protein [Actinoplanes friuliensis]AGZ43327.1 hypothetical protein AFR_25305 [Actinoplanes friuliensis DSM 7358]